MMNDKTQIVPDSDWTVFHFTRALRLYDLDPLVWWSFGQHLASLNQHLDALHCIQRALVLVESDDCVVVDSGEVARALLNPTLTPVDCLTTIVNYTQFCKPAQTVPWSEILVERYLCLQKSESDVETEALHGDVKVFQKSSKVAVDALAFRNAPLSVVEAAKRCASFYAQSVQSKSPCEAHQAKADYFEALLFHRGGSCETQVKW